MHKNQHLCAESFEEDHLYREGKKRWKRREEGGDKKKGKKW